MTGEPILFIIITYFLLFVNWSW